MIAIGYVLSDPRIAQTVTVERVAGNFSDAGVYQSSSAEISITGVIQPASADDVLDLALEGQRIDNFIRIYSPTELQMTDVIQWHDNRYKIVRLKDWSDFGYWFGIGEAV